MTEATKLKMWRVVRVTPPKVPVTLADCEDGRLAVVKFGQYAPWVIRKRVGDHTEDSSARIQPPPENYTFSRYLDVPQPTEQPVPKTFGELRDGQCFTCFADDTSMRWKFAGEDYRADFRGCVSEGCCVLTDTPIQFIPDIEMVLEEQPC